MLKIKKTKIVATLGPASSSKEVIKEMMNSGVNVFRINFSHASHEDALERINIIRDLNEELGFHVAVLADLQGPKLRVGEIKENTVLNNGSVVTFTTKKLKKGSTASIFMNYPLFAKDVNSGERILLDDGKLILEVVETNKSDTVLAKVVQGGVLNSKKGVNLPNTKISLPALTDKDINDAVFAIKNGVDWIALSFVRHKKDVLDLKRLVKKYSDFEIPIISKIEKPEALNNLSLIHI